MAILGFSALSLKARAAEARLPISPAKQKALITWSSDFDTKEAGNARWKAFCDHLGRRLLTKPGPGFLKSFICRTKDAADADTPWRIRMIEHADSFELKVSFAVDGKEQPVREWKFATKGSVLPNLGNDFLPVVLARMITENMPTGWSYPYPGETFVFDSEAQVFPLQSSLLLYDLQYDAEEKAWLPRINARLTKADVGDKAEEGGTYTVDTVYHPLKARRLYWVRGLLSKERENKYEKIVTNALQGKADTSLPRALLKDGADGTKDAITAIRSNYAGIRYGKSMLKSESLVTKLSMMSMFAEIGSGPLEGLRWSYDLYPEIKRGSGDDREHFGLRRASLGWAFNFQVPEALASLVDKIDLQPKIGLLDLKSHFFTDTEDGKTGLDFNVKNVFDLTLEGGVEKNSPWFRTRLWAGFSTANIGLSNKISTKVQSRRAGIDLYYDLLRWKGFDVNALGFCSLEHLEITKDPSSIDTSSPGLYSFGSNLVFAGLGATVSW